MVFFVASLVIIVVMQNLLISIIAETYEKTSKLKVQHYYRNIIDIIVDQQ